MSRPRAELQETLERILGSRNVYFQPPPSIKLKYPCIIYKLEGAKTVNADNGVYNKMKNYRVTVVDKNPDSEIPNRMDIFKYCRLSTFFTSENLNHFIFTIYF